MKKLFLLLLIIASTKANASSNYFVSQADFFVHDGIQTKHATLPYQTDENGNMLITHTLFGHLKITLPLGVDPYDYFLKTVKNHNHTQSLQPQDTAISVKPIMDEFIWDPEGECLQMGDVILPPGVTDSKAYFEQAARERGRRNKNSQSTVDNTWGTCPLQGEITIPVLLVEFSDLPAVLDVDVYDDIFNAENYLGNGTSVSEYFYHQSYGTLDVTFDVYDWLELPGLYDYYSTDSYTSFQMILDAMEAYDDIIDFSQYDSDGDGRIDGISIIHAGYANQEASGNVSNHARIFSGTTNYQADGVYYGNIAVVSSRVPPFMCNALINSYNHPEDCRVPVRPNAHEFVHVLGGPDVYAISHSGAQVGPGLGDLSMMVQDSLQLNPNKPINMDAWSRYFLGWLPAINIEKQDAGVYTIRPIDQHQDLYYLHDPKTMHPREFFLIEHRYKHPSTQDEWVMGLNYHETNDLGGLAVYHVDEEYIEDNYKGTYFNCIMYDPDGEIYNDTISHPGIVIEKRFVSFSDPNAPNFHSLDNLYTNEIGVSCGPEIWEGKFDSIYRVSSDPNCYFMGDTRSNTYNGLGNTEVVLEAFSPSGPEILAYLQSEFPDELTVDITSPPDGLKVFNDEPLFSACQIGNPLFSGSQVGWYWNYPQGASLFCPSDSCMATPDELGIPAGQHTITVMVTDESGREATAAVSIEILQVTAAFQVDTSIACEETPVVFTDNSAGATSWFWDFGDGATPPSAYTQGPHEVSYQNAGSKTVSLTVNGNYTTTLPDVVTIFADAVADFSGQQQGLTVNFSNNSQHAAGYLWDFGDGNTSTETNPEHTYETDGSYQVVLTAFSDYCQDDSFSLTIVVTTVGVAGNHAEKDIRIYPNPASKLLYVKMALPHENMKISFYNSNGSVRHYTLQNSGDSNIHPIDISALESGLWLIELEIPSRKYTQKLLVL
jgi:M6 family metalloprotease-like protein